MPAAPPADAPQANAGLAGSSTASARASAVGKVDPRARKESFAADKKALGITRTVLEGFEWLSFPRSLDGRIGRWSKKAAMCRSWGRAHLSGVILLAIAQGCGGSSSEPASA